MRLGISASEMYRSLLFAACTEFEQEGQIIFLIWHISATNSTTVEMSHGNPKITRFPHPYLSTFSEELFRYGISGHCYIIEILFN